MSRRTRFSIDDILPGSSRQDDSSSAESGLASRRPPLEDNFDEIIADTVASLVNRATKNRTDELMEWIEEKRLERMAHGKNLREGIKRQPLAAASTRISRTVITKYEDSSDDECTIVKSTKRPAAPKPTACPVISKRARKGRKQRKDAEPCDCLICGRGRKLSPITLSTLGSATHDTETSFVPSKVRKTYSARKRLTMEHHEGERIYKSKAIQSKTAIDYNRATGIDMTTLPSAEPMSKTIMVRDYPAGRQEEKAEGCRCWL